MARGRGGPDEVQTSRATNCFTSFGSCIFAIRFRRLYAPPITCLPSRNNAYFFPFFSLLVSTFLSYISAMRFRCEERKERNVRPSPVSSVYFIRNNDRPFPLYLCFSIISAISRKIYFSSTRFDRGNRGDGLIENKT